jgi:serine phosphatase RsbU (regulator of sigma subunit)
MRHLFLICLVPLGLAACGDEPPTPTEVRTKISTDLAYILREANALLSPDLRRGMYVTVLLAILDPRAHVLTVANAGHAPLLLVRGGKLTAVHSEGIAMGLDKGPVFDSTLKVVRIQVQPGDRAILYTPGVTRVNGADDQC